MMSVVSEGGGGGPGALLCGGSVSFSVEFMTIQRLYTK